LKRAVAIEALDQRAQPRQIGILLVGVQRDAVVVRQRRKFASNAGQARGVSFGIAVELELEIAGAGVLVGIDDAAGALDPIIEADRMPDRNAIEPTTSRQKLLDVIVRKIRRQLCIDPRDIPDHALEEIDPDTTQQRVQDRLVDLRRPVGGGKRRNVLLRASLDLRRDT